MPKRNPTTKPERWSRWPDAERTRPRGPADALERAIVAIGPLSSVHQPRLKFRCPCESCVRNLIGEAADEFNTRTLVIKGAPRKKTVADTLRSLSEMAQCLSDLLVASDDYSRDLLDEPIHRGSVEFILYETARGDELPKPKREDSPAVDGQLVDQLKALSLHAAACRARFVSWDVQGAMFDKGGNTNIAKDRLGPPAWFLARICWQIFENCRPREATASENGPFVEFVNAVHEYATGEIEENATLLHWIKKLARRLRELDQLRAKFVSLKAEIDELYRGPHTNAADKRIDQLEGRRSEVSEKIEKILAALSYRNDSLV